MKKHFSLLEVLIALVLITAAIPLLLTPFVYASQDQLETIEKIKQEKAALVSLTILLTDLHTGKIPLSQMDQETDKFKKLKQQGSVELWQVTFAPFLFEFIVKRNDDETKQ